jgi:hypothetical protein
MFIVHVDSDLEPLHHVNVGCDIDILEICAASVFRVEVGKVDESSCIYRF